ncbi:MAG: FAD-dependent monooxygenase [Planctomycetota bacterium]
MADHSSRIRPRSAVIIGAGAAGGAAAIALARLGWQIDLVESRPFPRAKVCGEFVSPAATDAFESVLDAYTLNTLGARRVREITFELGRRSKRVILERPAWTLSRKTLDAGLLAAAHDLGVAVHQPVRVTAVRHHNQRVEVETNSQGTLRADFVIHADGRGSLDPAGPTPNAPGLVGLKCHARLDRPLGGLIMRAGDGVYCGGVDVEDGLSTLAMCVTPRRLRRAESDRDRLLASIWPGYEPRIREGPWLACGVARSPYRAPGHPRSFRIGNAAAAVDPVGGAGIGVAVWSAVTLAGVLDRAPSAETAQRTFAALYKRRLRTRRPACRAAAMLMMRPKLLAAAWPLIETNRLPAVDAWTRLTGKRLARSASTH